MAKKAKTAQREAPIYMPMGIDGDMNVRMERPLRKELQALHDKVYNGLPTCGLGKFIAFAASLGADVIRQKYLSKAAAARRR